MIKQILTIVVLVFVGYLISTMRSMGVIPEWTRFIGILFLAFAFHLIIKLVKGR